MVVESLINKHNFVNAQLIYFGMIILVYNVFFQNISIILLNFVWIVL
jgi:hypothetical protein